MNLILNATTKSIEVVLGGAVTTTQLEFTAAWADNNGTSFTEGASDGATNDTTPVTLVAAPAASTRRIIKSITICNIDTVAADVIVNYNDNGTLRTIATPTLQPGDTWTTDGTYDDDGNLKTSFIAAAGGTNGQVQYNSNGSFAGISAVTSDGTNILLAADALRIADTNASHYLIITPGSDLTANRVLTITTGDSARTVTLSGNPTLADWFDQNVKTTGNPQFATIELGAASDTTLSRASAGQVNIEGVQVVTVSNSVSLTNKTIGAGVLQLAEGASVALDAAGSADGAYSGITIAGTAGATLAFGDLVYLAAADSRWELTDADAAATAGDVIIGICVLAAASDGDPTRILLYGNIRADAKFPALTIGAQAYVSTTAGAIQVAQPSGTDDVIRVVGFALTADELLFNPSPDYITHV